MTNFSHADTNPETLSEFLAPGLIAKDIPPLFPLLTARPLIGAMIALLRGGDDDVMIRLMVLREVDLRKHQAEQTRSKPASPTSATTRSSRTCSTPG